MLFDLTYAWSDDFSEYTEAASGEWLGQSQSRAVTFISPGGAVFSSEDAPLVVEVLDGPAEPADEADDRPDHYLLQLWPLRAPEQVVILRGY